MSEIIARPKPLSLERRDPSELKGWSLNMLDVAMRENRIDRIIGLFSGGHDSLATTHIASQHPSFGGVIHINTGTGIPETTNFVRETCKQNGWQLHELHPSTTYLQLIVQHGFPGPAQHSMMYRMLKDRPLQNAIPGIKRHRLEKLGLCAGARSQESARRMGHVEPVRKDRTWFWPAPIHDWTAYEVSAYIEQEGLARNPVKDLLHMSGECLCGAFAAEGERQEIATWYPETDAELGRYERMVRLSAELRVGGVDIPTLAREWGWGPKRPKRGKNKKPSNAEQLPLCWYCRGDDGEDVQMVLG